MIINTATRGARRRAMAMTKPTATHEAAKRLAVAAGLFGVTAMVGTFGALPLSSAEPGSPPAPAPDAQAAIALATLATLPIKGRAPKTGYDRSLFGDTWTDDVTVA